MEDSVAGKVAAFAHYGVTLTNDRLSWSGLTPKGEVVVGLWQDEFDYKTNPVSYQPNPATNELRVCAARSRRTNSVGRTRGVGERMGLWRFHPGRSLSRVMIAGQKERREERDPRITVGSVTFCTVDGVIWGRVRDIGWGGDKGFP